MTINALSTVKQLDWSGWFLGLWTSTISAIAGAIAGALGPMITDPKDFNLGTGLHHTIVSVSIGAGITGVVSLAKYLQMHPAPDQLQQALADAAKSTQKAADAIGTAQANVPTPEAK